MKQKKKKEDTRKGQKKVEKDDRKYKIEKKSGRHE